MSISNLLTSGGDTASNKTIYAHSVECHNQSYLDGGISQVTCPNGGTVSCPFLSGTADGSALEVDSGDNTIINILEDGIFYMELNVCWDPNVNGDRSLYILANNNSAHETEIAANLAQRMNVSMLKKLSAGDTIKAQAYQSSGGNLDINPTAGLCRYAITKLC